MIFHKSVPALPEELDFFPQKKKKSIFPRKIFSPKEKSKKKPSLGGLRAVPRRWTNGVSCSQSHFFRSGITHSKSGRRTGKFASFRIFEIFENFEKNRKYPPAATSLRSLFAKKCLFSAADGPSAAGHQPPLSSTPIQAAFPPYATKSLERGVIFAERTKYFVRLFKNHALSATLNAVATDAAWYVKNILAATAAPRLSAGDDAESRGGRRRRSSPSRATRLLADDPLCLRSYRALFDHFLAPKRGHWSKTTPLSAKNR